MLAKDQLYAVCWSISGPQAQRCHMNAIVVGEEVTIRLLVFLILFIVFAVSERSFSQRVRKMTGIFIVLFDLTICFQDRLFHWVRPL